MANFLIEDNVFIADLSLNRQQKWLELSTAGKFVDKNISIQITATTGTAATPATTIAQAPTITLTTATGAIVASYNKSQLVTPTVTLGWVEFGTAGTITTTGSSSITLPTPTVEVLENQFNITPGWIGSTTAYSVTAGSARVPNTTISQAPSFSVTTATGKIVASYNKSQSVSPTVVAGYITEGIAGTISTTGSATLTLPASTATVSDDTISIAPGWFGAATSVSVTAGSASTPATTIAQAPTISIVTATGVITAQYNKSQSVTPTVVAGWISEGTAGTISTTGSNTFTLGAAGVTVSGNSFSLTPGWVKSTTSITITSVSVTANNATVSGSNFNQAFLSIPSGYVSATTAARASFANSASGSTTYLDISDTVGAPILVSGDYLYINKGYTDNLKISLAKLIPDDASVLLADSHILSGYSAYNNNGVLIAGSIPSKDISDITISTNNITVPSGYYSTTAAVMIDEAEYNANVTLSAVTVTPSVSISNASTYGFTTTEPASGSYITVDPGANTPTYSATGSANITAAGYVAVGSKFKGATASVKVAVGTNYYAPVVTPTFSGSGLTTNTHTNVVTTAPAVTLSATGTLVSSTGYGVTTIQPTSGTYKTIDVYTAVTNGQTQSDFKVTRATSNYSINAGVVTTQTNAKILNGVSNTGTQSVTVIPTVTDNFDTLYIPITSITFSGGVLSVTTNTNQVQQSPVVTIDTTGTFASASNYGVKTSIPSGTDGIDYLSIKNNSTATTVGIAMAYANIAIDDIVYDNAAGLISANTASVAISGKNKGCSAMCQVQAGISNNFHSYYIPIVSTTFSGGGLTVSSTNAISTNMATTATSNYYIDAVATITATRAQVNYNNAAGAIVAHSGATAINASNDNSNSTATRVYIPQATFSTTITTGFSLNCNTTYNNVIISNSDLYNNSIVLTTTAVTTGQRYDFYCDTNGYVTNSLLRYINIPVRSQNHISYLQGVTLNKPASGEAKFSITVPNGEDDDMITFVFHVDPSGNVVVDDSTANAFS